MPVIDHPVHERTKIGKGFRYGCHNRKPFKASYFAPSGRYFADGRFIAGVVTVTNQMSNGCNFDLSANDPGCKGCRHRNKGGAPE